ncbi:MAG: TetR/AcrR family transcriptional regulator [Eubacteriales bacterium]
MARKRQSTKSRIVKTAWNLFYKNGYENTTVENIITASKTSKGTFYHYFKGKDSLLGSLSYLLDQKYEELQESIDPDLSSYDKLLLLNQELFSMIQETIDINLLAFMYASQLTTKEQRHLLDDDRIYFIWINEIIEAGVNSGEFTDMKTVPELVKLYTMYERALLYDWTLCKGKYDLVNYSSSLLPHVLDTFRRDFYK